MSTHLQVPSPHLRTGLLFLFSILASFLIAEVSVRIYERAFECHGEQPDPAGLYRRDPQYGHTLAPGYVGRLDGGCWETPVRVSSEGTRGVEIEPKKSRTRRILLVGDSYVFGLGVEEEATLSAALERELAASPFPQGRSIEVINAGVPGWTTAQAALLIAEKAERLNVDEILVHIYLGNDVEERMRFEERAIQEAGGADAAKQPEVRSLLPSSHLLRTIRERWKRMFNATGIERRPADVWFDVLRRDAPHRVVDGYALITGDLKRMHELSSSLGIPLRVVVTPFWLQLTWPTEGAVCRHLECRPGDIDVRKPNREMAAILDAAGIPFLDLTDHLLDAYERDEFGFILGHWDEAGTSLAADRIAEWLREAQPEAADPAL